MARVRLKQPSREQSVLFRWESPDELISEDHPARTLWSVLGTLELSAFQEGAKAVEGHAGRPMLDPRMMLCLWLYGISRGIGSAREIARRVQSDRPFQWIAGGVDVSHDVLTNFRVAHQQAFERLFTNIVGALMHKGLLKLDVVAQDGTRVRASAGTASFRRMDALTQKREQAQLHLKAVLAAADDPELSEQQRAARERAARDYQARVDAAIETLQELQTKASAGRAYQRAAKEKLRASTTDADARFMKMGNGGFEPAYNVQLAVTGGLDGGPRAIVGVQVTNQNHDHGLAEPMVDDLAERYGAMPAQLLADGGYASCETIEALVERGVEPVIAPSKSHVGAALGTPALEAWRARMASEQGRQLYAARASLSELANAHLKSRLGLARLLVRSVPKVTCVILLAAIAFNLLQHGAKLLA